MTASRLFLFLVGCKEKGTLNYSVDCKWHILGDWSFDLHTILQLDDAGKLNVTIHHVTAKKKVL